MKASPLQTEEEIKLVKLFLVLTVMMDLLEVESRKLNSPHYLKMSKIYVWKLKMIQKDIDKLMYSVRQEFRLHGVKIIEEVRNKTHIEAKYLCRGHNHTMILQGDIIKAEIELQMADQFGINILKVDDIP